MGVVTLDDELRARLNGLNEHLEIRDATGKLIGHFFPEEEYQRLISGAAEATARLQSLHEPEIEPPIIVSGQ